MSLEVQEVAHVPLGGFDLQPWLRGKGDPSHTSTGDNSTPNISAQAKSNRVPPISSTPKINNEDVLEKSPTELSSSSGPAFSYDGGE